MMLMAGTVPVKGLPLTTGVVSIEGEDLIINEQRIPCTQGTGAMISAALATTRYLGLEPPHAVLAADFGEGKGARNIYNYLIDHVAELSPEVLVLHYWLPDMALTRALCEAVGRCEKRPLLIADAASMYSAKAAGMAGEFDIFTPDATEIAFLADPEATHPAYIARHFFDTDISKTPELARSAYQNHSAAKLLLVKGATDFIIKDGEVIATIAEPDIPALEAIGGTGDTITGIVSAFVFAELAPHEAAILAAKSNRVAGQMAQATPATKVSEVIAQLPAVFQNNLCQWTSVCCTERGTL